MPWDEEAVGFYFSLLAFSSVILNRTLKGRAPVIFHKNILNQEAWVKPSLMRHEWAKTYKSFIIWKSRVNKIWPWTNFFSAKCHWPVSRTTNSFAIWVEIFYDNNSETLLTRWVTTKFVEPELRSCDTYSLSTLIKWLNEFRNRVWYGHMLPGQALRA